jgi:hypothetical protein
VRGVSVFNVENRLAGYIRFSRGTEPIGHTWIYERIYYEN